MSVDESIDLLLDPQRTAEIDRMICELKASPKMAALRAAGLLLLAMMGARQRVLREAMRSAYGEALRTLNDVLG